MHYRRLGRTNLRVSILGLGTGGPSVLGQRTGVPEAESQRVVRRALELGVNLIDTHAGYKDSEDILGRALDGVPRESYVMCTKFHPARRPDDPLYTTRRVRDVSDLVTSLDNSLRRLRTDHVDVYQLHAVRADEYVAVRDVFIPELRRQQAAGKIRFVGVTEQFASDHEHAMLTQALADDVWDTLMVGYNLLTPSPETHVLPEADRRNVGVLVMCAVRRVLAKPDHLAELIASLQRAGRVSEDALPPTDPLGWLVHDGVASVSAAAYRFASEHPAVSSVLSGTGNVSHLEENVKAIQEGPLPAADLARVREIFGPVKLNLGESTEVPTANAAPQVAG
jgi:L-galactose dehydrogenase